MSGRPRDALRRGRVRRHHDGAARLDRDEDLVDRRRRRVGRGNHRRDYAERLGDLDDLAFLEAVDHAHGLHRADELVHALRGEQVLLELVGHDAVAGFLHGQAREGLGVRRHGGGHGVDDGVDLGLGEFGERGLRDLGPAGEGPRLGDGRQVFVGLCCGSGGGHVRQGPGPQASGPKPQALGRMRSTSACGRGMTCTDTSSPTRRAAAAPGVGGGLDRPHIASHEHGDVAGPDVFGARAAPRSRPSPWRRRPPRSR